MEKVNGTPPLGKNLNEGDKEHLVVASFTFCASDFTY